MANIKSQIKRNRQNEAARARNRSTRSALRTRVKKLLGADDPSAATELNREAAKSFDQAAAKGVIHRNKAARAKSRLAKRLNAGE